jgi:hypothetical protein
MKTPPLALIAALLSFSSPATADPLLTVGDPIIAFDLDSGGVSQSDYPANDGPTSAIDQRLNTRYANTGRANSGFIVTLPSAAAVQSFVITTGSAAAANDPASWILYGTNDPVTSTDNSAGDRENWEEIGNGTLALPTARQTVGPLISVPNANAYSSYRMVFPTLRTAASATTMQLTEIQFYANEDGSGAPLLSPGLPIKAIHVPIVASSSPGNEQAPLAIDGSSSTKYLNFGEFNTGFIVTPSVGARIVRSILLTSANDAVERDPVSFQLFGTNDAVVSADHSTGEEENWTLVAEGAVALPAARFSDAPFVNFPNDTAWTSWRLVFPTVKNPAAANSMQIAEVQFFTEADGGGEPVCTPGDPVVAIQRAVSSSGYRDNNEKPANAIDGLAATKYLNFGERRTGFIVTPGSGSRVVQSFVLTTANDAEASDPASYVLFGTNDPVTSEEHSGGERENWTLVSGGPLSLPSERGAAAPPVSFTSTTAFTSWRLIFPTVKNAATANGMQLAEAQFFTAANGTGTPVLAPSDPIIAVQLPLSASSSPGNETPPLAIDGNTATKYLNFGERNTGFIVTPSTGPQIVRSLKITTANDAVERDPTSWVLYGTNDAILSQPDSEGDLENWTLIAKGLTGLTEDRFTEGPVVPFNNSTAYSSYRLIFPSVRNVATANSMQISEVQFFPDVDGAGTPILTPDDPTIGVQVVPSQSASPAAEESPLAIDGDPSQKYLNFGKENAGFIVTPSIGPSVVTGFTMTTANDGPERDPVNWELYGTNDTIVSGNHGFGNLETWSLISSGTLDLPLDRLTEGPAVTFANSTLWSSYRFVVRTVRDPAAANSLQFGEIQFDGTTTAPPTSAFTITSVTTSGNPVTAVTLAWSSEAGAGYTVQGNPGLGPVGTWINVGTVTATGSSTSTTVTLASFPALSGQPAAHFRVRRN